MSPEPVEAKKIEKRSGHDSVDAAQPTPGIWDDFLSSAGYYGVQMPYDGVKQIANSMGANLPDAQLVAQPEAADLGSARWFAQQAGAGLGMLPTFMATHGGVKSVVTASTATRLAVSGGLYSGVFTPTHGDANLVYDRLTSAASGAATFYTMGKVGSLLAPAGATVGAEGLAQAIRQNITQRLGGGLAGMASGSLGGIVHAESNSLLKTGEFASVKELTDSTAAYAAMGFGVGALSKGWSRKGESRQNAMSEGGNFEWRKIEGLSNEIATRISREAQASFDKGKSLNRQSMPGEASTAFENAGRQWAEVLGPEHPNVASALGELAYAELRLGNHGKALKAASKALSIEQGHFGELSQEVAHRYEQVSGIETAAKNFGSAAVSLESSLNIWKSLSDQGMLQAAQSEAFIAGGHRSMASRLATLLDASGQADKAKVVRSEIPEPPKTPPTLLEQTI